MTEFRVYWATEASRSITVDATDAEDAIEKSGREVDFMLCHQCAEISLGDPEALIVSDANGDQIWEDIPVRDYELEARVAKALTLLDEHEALFRDRSIQSLPSPAELREAIRSALKGTLDA